MDRLHIFALAAATVFTTALLSTPPAATQTSHPAPAAQRTRLILKDGSYQSVLRYEVKGSIVHYISAERNGAAEEVPLALVDLPATRAWAAQHASGNAPQHAVLSPELARDEADRAARTPEIAPGLKLPGENSAVALDTFSGIAELVPLQQEGGDLNKETAHDVRRLALNPAAAPHDILDLGGSSADIQLHTLQPTFFLRIGDDDPDDPGGSAITVDTHGRANLADNTARADSTGGAPASDYVLVRLLPRTDTRELDSFRIAALGPPHRPAPSQPSNIIELTPTTLPGGKWLQLTFPQPLEEGEYALVEVLTATDLNLLVWDFGIHPQARENFEAIRPQAQKSPALERR
jgi:hypothetical protein